MRHCAVSPPIVAWLAVWTATSWALPLPVAAAPSASSVRLAVLHVGTLPEVATALAAWGQELRLRTSIDVAPQSPLVRPEDGAVFAYPLLYWPGDRAFAPLSDQAVVHLRQHLSTGGTLIVDNVGRAEASQGFDLSLRREMARVFPQSFQRVPPGHVMFRAFYRLDRAVGRRADSHDVEGLRVGAHFAVLYTRNDLAGALMRLPVGGFALPVVPGGEQQREQALRLAVNLAVYALCLDYKDDHTHVMHLLRHRRTVATPPPVPAASDAP
jgi:hypothetical protein